MYIFLATIGELATVVGSIVISVNGGFNSILQISKNGYKIDKKVFYEYQKRQEEKKEKINEFKKVFFFPGVNLLRACITNIKIIIIYCIYYF